MEEHDIVYRDAPRPGESAPPIVAAPSGAQWSREILPDEALLFRYSALTFNGHRIRYTDRRFATEEEGYPGWSCRTAHRDAAGQSVGRNLPAAQVPTLSSGAVRPLFDTAPFLVCGRQDDAGRTVKLWAQETGGALALEATAALATGVKFDCCAGEIVPNVLVAAMRPIGRTKSCSPRQQTGLLLVQQRRRLVAGKSRVLWCDRRRAACPLAAGKPSRPRVLR